MFDKRLTKTCPESKKYILGNIVLQWIELLCNAAMIALIAADLEGLCYEHKPAFWWDTQIWMFGILILIRFLTTQGAVRMSHLASHTVKQRMREMIYRQLLRLGLRYREVTDTAALVQESVEGVDQLESYFGLYVPQFFYAFLAPITLFVLFGMAGSWSAAAVLLVCVPLIPGAIMMVQKIAKKLLAKYWGQYTALGSAFLENLQGMTTLKTYQADQFKNEQMNAESEHFRFVTMKVLTMQLNSIIIMDFFAYGGAALGIVMAVRAFAAGSIGLSNAIFMILLSADFFLPMRRLGSYFHVAMNGMAASDKIYQFLAADVPAPRTGIIEQIRTIRLEDVHFAYDTDREVLRGVDMEITEGSFVGIVGESGCGKSTVASLLLGRHDPQSGTLTIGGRPLGEIAEDDLLEHVTYIGHDSFFFKGTVRENLCLAVPSLTASDEVLWDVLERCALAGSLRSEDGLDTPLLENASNLSGGQRQRLALARAILHDSDVYIFDEATSSIDIESEEAILAEIHALAKEKTVILISHRLANVADADVIYCMADGRVTESGTHDALLQNGGAYASLWQTQQALETYGKEAAV